MKFTKRLFSSITALSLTLALVPAGGSVFAAAPAPAYSDNEYYFEDFEGVTSMDELDGNRKIRISATQKSQYKLETTEKNGTGLGSFDKSGGAVWLTEPNQNAVGAKFDLSIFENTPGAAIVMSADVFIPAGQKGNLKSSNLVMFLEQEKNGWAPLRYVAKLPQAYIVDGRLYFEGPNASYSEKNTLGANMLSDANSRLEYTNTEDGWVNLTSVLTYHDGWYETRYFVNNQPIISKDTNEQSVTRVAAQAEKNLIDYDKRINMNLTVVPNSTSIDVANGAKPFVLDNVMVSMYKGLEVEKTVSAVAGETSVDVPVYNAYGFADSSTVPAYVKGGMVDLSTATPENFKIQKIAKDDKLMLTRTAIEGFEVTAERGKLVFSNLPAMTDDDILKITYENLEGVDGVAAESGSVIITTGGVWDGPTDVVFKDIAGELIYPTDSGNIPLDVNKIFVDSDKAITLEGSNGRNYAAVNKELDFSEAVLQSGTTYTLKLDGQEYASFTTNSDGSIACSALVYEEGAIKGNIQNSTAGTAEYTLVIMGMDSNGDIVSTVTKQLPIGALSITPINEAVSGADSYKAVIWVDKTTLKPTVPQMVVKTAEKSEKTAASTSIFDNNRTMTVEGKLDAEARLSITLTDENEATVVYADDIMTADDGSYKYTLKIPENFATDTYKLTVTDGNTVIIDSKAVHYAKNSENNDAIGYVNGATDGDDLATIIAANQEKLEFFYDGYYDKFTPAEQGDVADILYEDIKNADLDTGDKPEATKAFRRSVLAKATEKGMVVEYEELEEYFVALSDADFMKWVNTSDETLKNSPVSVERREKWQSGILVTLKGKASLSSDDFVGNVREAALMECIKDPDGYENIKNMITDYDGAGYYDFDLSKVTNHVCSQLVGQTFTSYKTLADKIDELYGNPGGGGSSSSSGSFGGGGGYGGVSVKKSDATKPTPTEPNNQTDDTKGLTDIAGSWAADDIQKLYEQGIVSGTDNNTYEPERDVTREEFVAVACRLLKIEPILGAELSFADVPKDSWDYEYIRAAYQNGIINGVSKTEFGKGESITRQDMAVILDNMLYFEKRAPEAAEFTFIDNDAIADYAKESVSRLVSISVINGYSDNSFGPLNPATRAEMAAMINRFLNYLNTEADSVTDKQ